MNKKILAVITLVLALVVGLVACNAKVYEQSAVSGYDSSAVAENNGGMVVKQGDYIYFVNGYLGEDADNSFGSQYKSCLMRAKYVDGVIDESTKEVMSPKNVYGSSTNAGIYIVDGWIYYLTPNMDKDKSGEVNDTYLDIYRTSLDRKKTECIHTIGDRSVDYFVVSGAVYVLDDGSLYKIDLNKKKTKKIQDEDNYDSVMKNVSSLTHVLDNGTYAGYTLILSTANDDTSWKAYNTYTAVDSKGNFKTVFTDGSYRVDNVSDYETNNKIAIKDYKVSGDKISLYYIKTNANSDVTLATFTFDNTFTFNKDNEKKLMNSASSIATVKGIDENSAYITTSSTPYLYKVDSTGALPQEISTATLDRQIKIYAVKDGYIYYMDNSSATELFRFKADGTGSEEKIADVSILSDWHGAEVLGDYLYYLDSDTSYMFRAKLAGVTEVPEKVDMLVAKMLTADYEDAFSDDEE